MNSAHISRRIFVRGAAFSSLSLLLAFAGCKPAEDTTNSSAPAGNTAPSSSSTGNSASTTTASTGGTIAIGHYGSLTGTTATFGKSTDNGIRMAFDEINAKNPPLGKKLELFTEDDASRTEQVPQVVQKLINQNNVLVLMGEVASSRSLAAAPIAQQSKVPMVTASSTNPKVTQVGDFIFRTCFIDLFQGRVMAEFARNNLKVKKVAILKDEANDYSKGLTEVFTKQWNKAGEQVVATESYSEGDKDFQSQLTKIKGTNPDAIFIPGYYSEVGNIAVQARRLGLKQPLLGCDGWDSPKLYQIGGAALEGCYFSNHYTSQSKDPRVVKFVNDYKGRYGEVPDAIGAVAYDAAYIVADAIKRAGSEDRQKVRDALATTKDYPGVTGTISIDKNRDAVKPAVVVKIADGHENYVTTIKP